MYSSEKSDILHRTGAALDETWRAKLEADRCLGCYDAPCIMGCPTRINIPEFIGRIQTDNYAGAYDTLIQKNPLPSICGLVCPTEYLCEGRCVVAQLSGRPVGIAALQHFVCTQAQTEEDLATTRQEKVVVVGGGPAGIACALRLRRFGFSVDLFDSHDLLGGLLMYSIPNYRLPDLAVENELARLRRSGIQFHLGEAVDHFRLQELIADYQAVFLGIGLSSGKDLETPGSDLKGVYSALDYLAKMRCADRHECERPALEGHVVVVGCGNVALDAACVAARSGAERVTVVYRRTRAQMPAWESEYLDALALGVEFRWLTGLSEIMGENGQVKSARLKKMRLLAKTDASGRKKVEPLQGAEEIYACSAVILAVGQAIDFDGLASLGIEINRNDLVSIHPGAFQTSHAKVFAGGDAINGGTYVVQAIADGWQAAEAIHRFLNGEGKL